MVGEMQILRDSTYLCHCPSPRGTERQLQIQPCGVSVTQMVLLNLGKAMCVICSAIDA